MSDNAPLRLFLGFSVNKNDERQFFDIQQRLISTINTEAKPVNQSNFHITLTFLGQVRPDNLNALIQCCQTIPLAPFQLTFNKIECWPHPKIVCVSATPCSTLINMAECANTVAAALDLHQSEFNYRPHITLFRKAKGLPSTISGHDHKFPIVINPTHLHLYQSVSAKNGVIYQILHSWPLSSN